LANENCPLEFWRTVFLRIAKQTQIEYNLAKIEMKAVSYETENFADFGSFVVADQCGLQRNTCRRIN